MKKSIQSGKIVVWVVLFLVICFCAYLAVGFPTGSMTIEGIVGSSSAQGAPLTSGLNLANVASAGSKVACADKWASLNADVQGYTMVNALQEPDGTCIIDFMDTDGLYYTQTWGSQNNQASGAGSASTTPAPVGSSTGVTSSPQTANTFVENTFPRPVVYN